ncbi:MAG: hypothetical protein E5W28_05015 [Mesorhizobium sp.]|uniref:hypothetical protein n=1 Tax=Mesorhizobium sp. TaxID=1871066 RepID=UPI000FE7D286|nr:hypothetical protein [Mesorhizobium sp.]RWE84234.1 MAG: hypothetical protein EOS63_03680 [Mesorhizobium sp.]TIU39251.1 MAG: hypothetical protein E5W28_05015 [Mesorhizobium sp.]TIU44562.1 MAG: hypothetical protein E5W31_00390 [Mesorhizobium sp.]TJW64598.1 MAG: hypothetical protein E5V97_06275 [Mesorhizobium sp.]
MNSKVAFSGILSSMLLANAAFAYDPFHNPGHPHCPTNDGTTRWVDFISGRVPDVPGHRASFFGIQFRYAKTLADRSGLGNLDPAACYSVSYNVNRAKFKNGFESFRNWSYDRMNQPEYSESHHKDGLPGDPLQYELNVEGFMFLYNEAGEVYDTHGQLAGQLVCYTSNECEKYRY